MKTQARVVVIGGGVVGCSVLYHLTRRGWHDVMLIERAELTSGSTWHAAGGFYTLNGDPNVARLQAYTVSFYKEIEEISGQSCGLHLTGGLQLADTPERLDWLRMAHARGRVLGMETEIVSAREAKEILPLIDERHFVGALWDPIEGHLDPSGTTHAYAKAARIAGAEIVLRNRVTGLAQRADGTWEVATQQGTVLAEHVVNAGGLWAREVGRMVGLELPVLAMEHHYLLTEDMPEIAELVAATGREMVHAIDFSGEIYTRQERGGMLLGTYERAATPWSPRETPWDFGQDLLPPDLDRIAPSLAIGFEHFPALKHTGIKRVVNGPFTFSPDGNPLVGPVRGLTNYWCACAVMAGFSQGGGVGLALANWMVDGDPGFDVWGMDVARFGPFATPSYTNAKVRETYSRRFRIRYPNEELTAGRPHQTTPLYDRLVAAGAVMGDSWGLEAPLWFAPPGSEARDIVSFRRSNDFEAVGAECRAVREAVGITEIANFAKYEITGPGAAAYLDRVLAGRRPADGRMTLTPMLNDTGKLIGDFTLACAGCDRFFMWGSSQAEVHHMRWFEQHLPRDGSVRLRAIGLGWVGLAIAGPRARDLLARVTAQDVSTQAFPFLASREMEVAGAPCRVSRISYTGDLGYEIWMTPDYEMRVYLGLKAAGEDLGLRDFGLRALLSLRLEKNFGTWFREFRPIYGPVEAGLDRFVDYRRGGFIGHAAASEERRSGGRLRRICLAVEAEDADAIGDEPIWHDGDVVGWVTSGGYAHHARVSIAQGYVPRALAERDAPGGFEVEILGARRRAHVITKPLFDPEGSRMRL